MTHRITAPVKRFSGMVVGVAFTDGVGQTDNLAVLPYFRRHGYVVEEIAPPVIAEAEVKRPGKSGSKAAWVAYAAAQGVPAEKVADLTTAQLVEQIDELIAEAAATVETENGGQQ